MKKRIVVCFLILILALTACGGNADSKEPVNSKNENQITKTQDKTKQENYVPQKAVPKNLPVYPGATLFHDEMTFWENHWIWDFYTTGSANEIIAFFETELKKMGYEILEGNFGADRHEFYLFAGLFDIQISNLDSEKDPDKFNPDTPGRGYSILVNLESLEGR